MDRFVVWTDAYSVSNPLVDEQHKQLFELANEMWKYRKESDKRKRKLFKQIYEELRSHCADEERILAGNGCEHIKTHRDEHRKLLRQFEEILGSCQENSRKIWYSMMTFLLQELLVHHLIGVDMKCRDCLRQGK